MKKTARPGVVRARGSCGVVTRVPFQGQLPIGLLELIFAGVSPHPQRFVVTLHRPAGAGAGAGAGARGGAGTLARVKAVVTALMVLSCSWSRAPALGQPASAAAAAAARDSRGARWPRGARAAARGCAEGAAPADAAPHGEG